MTKNLSKYQRPKEYFRLRCSNLKIICDRPLSFFLWQLIKFDSKFYFEQWNTKYHTSFFDTSGSFDVNFPRNHRTYSKVVIRFQRSLWSTKTNCLISFDQNTLKWVLNIEISVILKITYGEALEITFTKTLSDSKAKTLENFLMNGIRPTSQRRL